MSEHPAQPVTSWMPMQTWPTKRSGQSRWLVVRKRCGVVCQTHASLLDGRRIKFHAESAAQARADELNEELVMLERITEVQDGA